MFRCLKFLLAQIIFYRTEVALGQISIAREKKLFIIIIIFISYKKYEETNYIHFNNNNFPMDIK